MSPTQFLRTLTKSKSDAYLVLWVCLPDEQPGKPEALP